MPVGIIIDDYGQRYLVMVSPDLTHATTMEYGTCKETDHIIYTKDIAVRRKKVVFRFVLPDEKFGGYRYKLKCDRDSWEEFITAES